MSAKIIQLDPHANMSVDDCINYLHRNKDEYKDILAIGYDENGELIVRSSHMSRAEAAFMLLLALDYTKEN